VLGLPIYLWVSLSVIFLLYTGYWTDRRYARFEQFPAHYDFRGRATRLSPRKQMAWAVPIGLSVLLIGLVMLLEVMPAQYINDDPEIAIWSMIIGFPLVQALVLWLLSRWAARQS
jgi:hypothetical protein